MPARNHTQTVGVEKTDDGRQYRREAGLTGKGGSDGMGDVTVEVGGVDADRPTSGSGVGVRPLSLSHFVRILLRIRGLW